MATPYRPKPYRRRAVRSYAPFGPILPFLLPLPLLFTVFRALANGAFIDFVSSVGSLVLFFLAGIFLRRAKFYERKSQQRKWQRPTRVPWRFSAALFTGVATSIAALMIVDHPFLISIGFGFLAFIGVVFLYGRDPHYQDLSAGLVGVTSDEVMDALEEAEHKIAAIERAADQVEQVAIRQQLDRIADKTRGILKTIEEDPKDLRRARKFLKVYLDGARKVAENYANAEHLQNNTTIEANLTEVLTTIEQTIEEQQEKLLHNDILELDVQIEVLQTQLKHEGIT